METQRVVSFSHHSVARVFCLQGRSWQGMCIRGGLARAANEVGALDPSPLPSKSLPSLQPYLSFSRLLVGYSNTFNDVSPIHSTVFPRLDFGLIYPWFIRSHNAAHLQANLTKK